MFGFIRLFYSYIYITNFTVMKNYYSLLITICFFSFANAQIVNIPDINFKNKLLMSSYNNNIALDQFGNSIRIDINNDGQIQASELVIIRKLYLDNSSISDLTGIASFTYLNELVCNNNTITNLNVSTIVYLIKLDCSYNQITSLNVSGLKYLQELNFTNNKLTALNVVGVWVSTNTGVPVADPCKILIRIPTTVEGTKASLLFLITA